MYVHDHCRANSIQADRSQHAVSHTIVQSDAAARAIIAVLPAHPIITSPVAAAATGRSKGSVYDGLAQLQEARVLRPLSQSARNQSWEAAGLLDLLEELEAGGISLP